MALFHQLKRAEDMGEPQRAKAKPATKLEAGLKEAMAVAKGEAEPAALHVRRGRKPSGNTKQMITLRLSPDVVDWFRATGEGWQTRMDEALRRAAGL